MVISCSKTSEQRGDSMMRNGDKTGAYMYYQRAISSVGESASKALRDKYLRLTIERARDRLANDESLRSVELFHNDFKKYADARTDPQVLTDYAIFACDWADSIYAKYEDIRAVSALLEETKAYDGSERTAAKIAGIKGQYAQAMLTKAHDTYAAAIGSRQPLDMVAAEYYVLCADKYAPGNVETGALLAKIRKANLNTYSAYDRGMEDGRTNPDVDRFNVYLAITRQSVSGGLRLEGSIYNLSPEGPFSLEAGQFMAIGEDNQEFKASGASKFEKVTLDSKQESKFSLVFPGLSKAPLYISFKEGKREAQKWFP